MEALRFESIYQERVWGGRTIAGAFGRALPPDRAIGESWEVVDRPEAQSVVRGGRHAGRTLRELIEAHGRDVMGPQWPVQRPFPILVKWLDCRERLSLQVHPPAERAAALGGEPKTENWFIAEAAPGAALIVGLRPGVTRAQFEQALAGGTLEQCVNRLAVAPGDSILVRSGTVHAIDAGNLILEIQQNSDTTYRVYDWGRTGPGPPARASSICARRWRRFSGISRSRGQCAPPRRPRCWRIAPSSASGASRWPAAERLSFPPGSNRGCCTWWLGAGRSRPRRQALGRGDNVLLPYRRPVCLHRDRGQPSARDGEFHLRAR